MLPLLVLTGCGAEAADGHDSGSGKARPAWTVVAPADLRIGASETGSDALVFPVAGERLAHGDIAIADAGNHRVDVFDSKGRKVRSIGREGRGPGEFSSPSWLGVRGDTLLVWDIVQSRLTRFDTAGILIGTDPPVTDLGSFPRVAGQRADGSLLTIASVSGEWRAGTYRDSLLILWMWPDGRRDTVATAPGDDQFGTRSQNGRVSETTTLPFGRRTVVAVHGQRVYLGTADSPVIVAASDGRTWDTVARVLTPPVPVTRQDIDEFWSRLVVTGSRSSAAAPAGIEYPRYFPPYTDLRVASGGDTWICLPSRPSEWSVSSRWLVFAPDGTLRGSVEIPGRNRVLQVGNGWILVAETDADDRQMVVKYSLSPP
ncbi:6-bladed beta-propeller [Longimicrobium sp.]|uniref:6-bladed beta-propeller n=1 Tax=Longimicrobium sp. TaxID=2029185 RepID=UPI003B3AFDF0